MAKVLGVGGVFFKAADKEALKAWYVRVLKFELTKWGGVYFPPLPVGGTVWSPFAADTDHFKPSDAPFMINLVVDDLAAMLDHVRSEGVEVLSEEAMDGMGRFAWIMDPAGTKIELWQPE
jgi:predicted enzyme related to lactoylglutathione lyase